MTRFWLSWYQPGEDYRPLTFPPNDAIRGWWCSGETADGTATLCAVVDAPGTASAKKAVALDWPDHGEWRFVNPVAPDFLPNDRFPVSEWMKPRLAELRT